MPIFLIQSNLIFTNCQTLDANYFVRHEHEAGKGLVQQSYLREHGAVMEVTEKKVSLLILFHLCRFDITENK